MTRALLFIVLTIANCAHSEKSFDLSEMEGAWWSDTTAPTADFAIQDGQIWLDFDSRYHPLRIDEGNVLVYDLGPEMGEIKRKIVAFEEDRLTLESEDGQRTVYVRRE